MLIDDFGTIYLLSAKLKHLPTDESGIDRNFGIIANRDCHTELILVKAAVSPPYQRHEVIVLPASGTRLKTLSLLLLALDVVLLLLFHLRLNAMP